MAASNEKMIRGKAALARAIFNDQRKRRLIPKLQENGWPIFDVGGKPSAYPSELKAAVARKTAAQRRGQRRRSKIGVSKAKAASTEVETQ